MSTFDKTIRVGTSFDDLLRALDRADSKGYMPDALVGEWEAFDWEVVSDPEPAQPASEPLSAWQSAFDTARDAILNGRGPLEGEGMTNEQTNAVLSILDDEFDAITAPTVKGADHG